MVNKKCRRKVKPEKTQEQLWSEHRGKCRGPAWWSKYSTAELDVLQRRGHQLVESGHGAVSWEDIYGAK